MEQNRNRNFSDVMLGVGVSVCVGVCWGGGAVRGYRSKSLQHGSGPCQMAKVLLLDA